MALLITRPAILSPSDVMQGHRPTSRAALGGAAGLAAALLLLLALVPGTVAHGPTAMELPQPLPAPAPVVLDR